MKRIRGPARDGVDVRYYIYLYGSLLDNLKYFVLSRLYIYPNDKLQIIFGLMIGQTLAALHAVIFMDAPLVTMSIIWYVGILFGLIISRLYTRRSVEDSKKSVNLYSALLKDSYLLGDISVYCSKRR